MRFRQVAKTISRRDMLVLSRATIAAIFVAGCTSRKSGFAQTSTKTTMPKCIVTPEQTEGPYFVDEKLNRSDIRTDPADGILDGLPLQLTLRVSGAGIIHSRSKNSLSMSWARNRSALVREL